MFSRIRRILTELKIKQLLHNILFRAGLLNNFGLLATGESKNNSINPLFITADVTESDYKLVFDESFSFPFQDESINFVYSSHNLEHLSERTSNRFFSEVKRILSTGGELSIEVPDCDFIYNSYREYLQSGHSENLEKLCDFTFSEEVENNVKFFQKIDQTAINNYLNSYCTKMSSFISCYCNPSFIGDHTPVVVTDEDAFNQNFINLDKDSFFNWCISRMNNRQKESGGHVYAWYPERLVRRLEEFDFDAKLRGFRESRFFSSRLARWLVPDRQHRGFYSFRISARKK